MKAEQEKPIEFPEGTTFDDLARAAMQPAGRGVLRTSRRQTAACAFHIATDLAGGPGAGSLLQTLGAERSASALFRIFSHCARTVRVFSGENSVLIA